MRPGDDLLGPERLEVVLGVMDKGLSPPSGWTWQPTTAESIRLADWEALLFTLREAIRVMDDTLARTAGASDSRATLADLHGVADEWVATFAVPLPSLNRRSRERVLAEIRDSWSRLRPPAGVEAGVRGVVCGLDHSPGPTDWTAGAVPGPAAFLDVEGPVFVMGPALEEVQRDPARAARAAADAYVKFLGSV